MGATINERLVELMSAVDKNTSSFARAVDKAYTSIESIVKGKTKPSFDLLEAILRTYPNVNPSWLINGEGTMFKTGAMDSDGDSYLQEHLKRLEENFATLAGQLQVKDQQLQVKDQQIISLTRMLELALGKYRVVFVTSGVGRPSFLNSGVQLRVQPVNP